MTCAVLGKPHSVATEAYIVRISRPEQDDVDRWAEVAVLKAISGQLPVPTPHFVQYDVLSNNVLEKPYMIQKRITGKRLSVLLDNLNLEQKKCLVRKHISLFHEVASIEAATGDNYVRKTDRPANSPIHVNKVLCSDTNAFPVSLQKSVDHMLELCEMWRQESTTC